VRAEDPNSEEGAKAFQQYSLSPLESIANLNGNLMLTIPIAEQSMTPEHTLKLQLIFNSGRRWSRDDEPFVLGESNTGLGFRMHLGRIFISRMVGFSREYSFEDPDGSTHKLEWHSSDDRYYTIDGSALRVDRQGPASSPTAFIVRYPNGLTLTLGHIVERSEFYTDTDFRGWYVSALDAPPFGTSTTHPHHIAVQYNASYPHCMSRISDSHLPLVKDILFSCGTTVTSVTGSSLTAPNGAYTSLDIPTWAGLRTRYELRYGTVPITLGGVLISNALVLRELRLPSPLVPSQAGSDKYSFEYDSPVDWEQGNLSAWVTPRGARSEYSYVRQRYRSGSYLDDAPGGHGGTRCVEESDTGPLMIVTLKRFNEAPNDPMSSWKEWHWQREPYPGGDWKPTGPYKVVETDPEGNDTVTLYHQYREYRTPCGGGPGGSFLADGPIGYPFQIDRYQGNSQTGSLLSRRETTYACGICRRSGSNTESEDVRVQQQIDRIYDGNVESHVTTWSDPASWDDRLKQYQVVVEIDRHDVAYRKRIAETNDASSPGYTDREGRWIVDRVTRAETLDLVANAPLSRTLQTYDGYGQLQTRRDVWLGSTPPSEDIVHAYSYYPAVAGREDRAFLVSQVSTQFADARSPAKTENFDYDAGVLTKKWFGNYSWRSMDRSVDAVTGWTFGERDSLGLNTSYTRDFWGRKTSMTPPGGELPKQFSYPTVNESLSTRGDTGSNNYESVRTIYEGNGRESRTETRTASGGTAYILKSYTSKGQISQTTVPALIANATPAKTTYDYLDPLSGLHEGLDRPTRVNPPTEPGQPASESRYVYRGLCVDEMTKNVRVSSGGLEDSNTSRCNDEFGRIASVDAPEGADAVYGYDVLNRLTSVSLSSGSLVQSRAFQFDSLGRRFLSTEPESGTTTVLSWDASGNPIQVRDARGSSEHYFWENGYDEAGRRTTVHKVWEDVSDGTHIDMAGDFEGAIPVSTDPSTAVGWSVASGSAWNMVTSCQAVAPARGTGMAHPGAGGGSCSYSTSASTTTDYLWSPQFSVLRGQYLSFRLNRQVRQAAGSLDVFVVEARLTDGTIVELFRRDASHGSWGKWQTPEVVDLTPLADHDVRLRFGFKRGDTSTNLGGMRGVLLDDVRVERRRKVLVESRAYDISSDPTDLCGAAICSYGGLLTGAKTYSPVQVWSSNGFRDWVEVEQRYFYSTTHGRLVRQHTLIDPDGSLTPQAFQQTYRYDNRGLRSEADYPSPIGTTPGLTLGWNYRNGSFHDLARVGTGDLFVSNAEFGPSGALTRLDFANGASTVIDRDAANRPSRIQAIGPTGTLWDSGTYTYDGAGNIDNIGTDYYRYDLLNRLRVGRTAGKDSSNSYDAWGNMTDYSAPGGPQGLGFATRSYLASSGIVDNRIHDPGFVYDVMGNLRQAPTGTPNVSWLYQLDGRDRMLAVGTKNLPSATLPNYIASPLERYLYDASGNRVFREDFARAGKWSFFLRDDDSNVLSEWEADPAGSTTERKRYLFAVDQAVASGAPCGPAPAFELQTPWNVGTSIAFKKLDNVPTLANETYVLDIQPLTGQRRVYESVLASSTTSWINFSIPKSAFAANVTNRVRIEGKASCGGTGYSDEVDFIYSDSGPGSPSCVDTLLGLIVTDPATGPSSRKLVWGGTCLPGTTFDLYFQPVNTTSTIQLTGGNTSGLHTVGSIGMSGGRGQYWVVPHDPTTGQPMQSSIHLEVPVAVMVVDDGGEGEGELLDPPPPSLPWVYRFHHADHLGSTRVETDELGHALARHDYYPFGTEIPPLVASDNSHRFTGHERDQATGCDYMGARFYSPSLTRFLSADNAARARAQDPQSWNLLAYTGNNPLNRIDPDGRNWFKLNGAWEWHPGTTYTYTANGQSVTVSSPYTHLLVFKKTGVNEFGAAVGTLTLYEQNRVIATSTAFSGGNGFGQIPNGTFTIALTNRGAVDSIDDLKPNGTLKQWYGIQTIANFVHNGIKYLTQREWGTLRAALNEPEGEKRTEYLGNYLHGKLREDDYTHGCICERSETVLHRLLALDPKEVPRVPVDVH
jgi:RHS repeat-associated protein